MFAFHTISLYNMFTMSKHSSSEYVQFNDGTKADRETAVAIARNVYNSYSQNGFLALIRYRELLDESSLDSLPDLDSYAQAYINHLTGAQVYELEPILNQEEKWNLDGKIARLVLRHMISVTHFEGSPEAELQNPFKDEDTLAALYAEHQTKVA